MIKELYGRKCEIIEKDGREKVIIEGVTNRGRSLIIFENDNLDKVFVSEDSIQEEDPMKRVYVCRFIDDKPYVIYKINVDMKALIDDKTLSKEYVKEIKEDGNKSLLAFMLKYFTAQRGFRRLSINKK